MAEKVYAVQRTGRHVIKRLQVGSVTGEVVGTGDGSADQFGNRMLRSVRPGTLTLTTTDINDVALTVTDDGNGNLVGDIASDENRIDYATGTFRVRFSAAVKSGTDITAAYTSLEYESGVNFGTYGVPGSDTTHLNFPWSLGVDGSGNIYICDGTDNSNGRIVKLDSGLNYVAELDVSNELGRPYAIALDPSSGDLFAAGIFQYRYVSVAKIDVSSFTVDSYDNNIALGDTNDQPMGISPGFTSGDFLISGLRYLLRFSDPGTFVIDDTNNKIDFEEIYGEEITATIANGTYTSATLATAVEAALTAAGPATYDVTVSGNKFYIGSDCSGRLVTLATNDLIGFEETPGVEKVAQIAPGTYTLLSLASEIQNKLNFNGDSNYTVILYADDRFQIISDGSGGTGIFNLVFGSGSHHPYTIAGLIGFDPDVDQTGSLTYLAPRSPFSLLWKTGSNATTSAYSILGFDRVDDFLYKTYVSDSEKAFGSGIVQRIEGEYHSKFVGHTRHTNGDVYMITERKNGAWLSRINSSYVNIGDSNKISKHALHVQLGANGDLYIYDADNERIVRYDENLNFVEVVFQDTGDTIDTDCYDVTGIFQADI